MYPIRISDADETAPTIPARDLREGLKHITWSRRRPLVRSDVELRLRARFYCTQPPHMEMTKLLCPHHEGAGSPHPIRVGGPDLWYQMALVDTTVEQSLVSSAEGTRGA